MARDPRDKIRDHACELCPLNEGADHVCMMGSGPPHARIVIVGEAPGAQEDEEGTPFVGKSGQLLDELLLEHAKIERDDCYVTNVAKCRPPRNRTPDKSEIKTCVAEYFSQELKMLEPDFVLTLGNPALTGVLGKSGITKHHGNRYEREGYIAMPTFHPAACLRNPKYFEPVEADLKLFGEMVRGEDSSPQTKVRMVTTVKQLRWLLKKLSDAKDFTYDIETNEKEEWRPGSKIVSIAFTIEPGEATFVPLFHSETPWKNPQKVIDALAPVCRRKGKHIAHNGKFDAKWLRKFGAPIHQTFDTMLAAHMLNENRLKRLKDLAQVQLGAEAYDLGDEIKEADTIPLKKLAVYNGKDTDYTHQMYLKLRQELKENPRLARIFVKLTMPASNALVDIEQYGVQVDWERWKERSAKVEENVQKIEDAMLLYIPEEKREEFNFQSHPQIAEWLFEDLGLPVLERSKKTKKPSSKESVLQQLKKQSRPVKLLLKFRKWNKYRTTYIGPWKDLVDEDKRLHPSYKIYGTVTGRLSCADPNLQNVPREPFMRSIIGARPGYVLIDADYSQIELRIAAMLAHETRMLRVFAADEDIHLNTACDITGKAPSKIDSETRFYAKAVNFGFLYGMYPKKFVEYARDTYEIVISEAAAEKYRKKFFRSYPQLLPWHDRQRRLAHRYERVSSPLGRIRHLPDIRSGDSLVQMEAERQAINSPVQSTASDLMLVALVVLHGISKRSKLDFRIVGSVHDNLLNECHEDHVDKVCPIIKEVMLDVDRIYKMFGARITVPIKVDMKIGSHWSEPGAKEWNG